MTKASIVVTTIFEPNFLTGYIENIERYGRADQVDVIVIPDRKTPPSVRECCNYFRSRGYAVTCPSIEAQDVFLSKFSNLRERIPYDSDNRRNVGFLMALDQGAEVLISIDDDNYCLPDTDFVGEHSVVGTSCTAPEITSDDGWFNIATRLKGEPTVEIYPRGFPYFARHRRRKIGLRQPVLKRVTINAGLWLKDPDVDAITRLALAPCISTADTQSVFLGPEVWSPINSQNTGIARNSVAAYYYVRMGHSLSGMSIDRYGDILSGYFVQKCAKVRGDTIRIGGPIAEHQRTPHNPFKDLYNELGGMVIIEELLPWLMEVQIARSSYAEAYLSLADQIEAQAGNFSGFVWDQGGRDFLASTAANMRAWVDAVCAIG